MRKKNDIIFNLLFPRKCPVCFDVISGEERVCKDCRSKLHVIREPICRKCGKPLADRDKEYCYDCTGAELAFEYGRCVYEYRGTLEKSMNAFKFQGCKDFAGFYADEICANLDGMIKRIAPDVIVPVPIHSLRRIKRGYNQSEEIAKFVGEYYNIPVKNMLKRIRNTRPQKELSKGQRRKNISNAFGISDNYEAELKYINKVLIIDDIYTTGSTINECAGVLKKYGVKKVYFISVCSGRM